MRRNDMPCNLTSTRHAFTLIELLVVMSVIALLIALLLPGLSRARSASRAMTGRSALNQVIMAYTAYADDNDGWVMPGYRDDLIVRDHDGNRLSPPVSNRYPWRLIKYLDWNWKALYYDREPETGYYERSVYPRFGLNSWFVGGDLRAHGFDPVALHDWGPFYVRRIEDAPDASRLIVFGDSVYSANNIPFDPVYGDGFFHIKPPYFEEREWDLDNPVSAGDVGYVAERWNGRATVSFLDGHAEARALEEIDNMLLWAPLARSKTYLVSDGL